MMPHPAVFTLLWIILAIILQSLRLPALLLLGIPLLILTFKFSGSQLATLLRRTRWIMLTLLLIYGYATPGEAILGQFGPSQQGLADGFLQLSRMVLSLLGLSILLAQLSRMQLIAGLYVLAFPLRIFGLSRERIAVRLALTLHYAESMQFKGGDWRSNIDQMLAPVPAEPGSLELRVAALGLRDGMWLLAGSALPGMALLWQSQLA
jgi:energy-coupling factor transporter transmembrane protein EcfT